MIFSNIQASETSNVTGMPGFKFYANLPPQAGRTFERPFGSPDGERWAFRAWIRSTAGYHAIIRGDGRDGSTASVVVLAGSPAFFDTLVSYYFVRRDLGISDDGSFAFACDTTAPTNSDEIVARWTPSDGFELIAREGAQAPGQPPGIGYGGGAGDLFMLADDRVAFGSGGLTGNGGDAVFVNASIGEGEVLIQSNVTVPEGQMGGAFPLSEPGSFAIDATGETYAYSGRLANGRDIIAINNNVAAEPLRPLPGGYPGVFDDVDVFDEGFSVSPYNGHYAFRCPANFDGGWDHVVIVDGAVVAATDTPITPGSSRVWRNGDNGYTAFFQNIVNSRGDFVIFGRVAEGAAQGPAVMIWNGSTQLLQSGDLVDLTGDGAPDAGYRVDPAVDGAFLTNDGRMYFTGALEDAFGQRIGEAFMWLAVPLPGDPNCDGAIDFFDIDPFLLALFDEPAYAAAYPDCWHITADINRDGSVDFFDIDPFLNCLFGDCP